VYKASIEVGGDEGEDCILKKLPSIHPQIILGATIDLSCAA